MLNRFILLLTLLSFALHAEMIDGVAILVKEDPITLYDITQEMEHGNLTRKEAIDALIRKTLESQEITQRQLHVEPSEVFKEIKTMAQQNNMTTSQLYDAMLRIRGLDETAFKAKIKENLLNKKLYDAIAFSKIDRPSDVDVEEYYRLHINEFNFAETFSILIYSAASQQLLQEKIANPMLYNPEIHSESATLEYAKLNPQLAQLLSQTNLNQFTPIIPSQNNQFMTFFVQEKSGQTTMELDKVRNQVEGAIMNERRISVLNDYFARLRMNADIKILRKE